MLWIILLVTLTGITNPTNTTQPPLTNNNTDLPLAPDGTTEDKASAADTSTLTSGTPQLTLPATPNDICTDGNDHKIYKLSWESGDSLVVHEEMVVEITCTRKELYQNILCLQSMAGVELGLNKEPNANDNYEPIAEDHYSRTVLPNMTVFHFIPQYELHTDQSEIRLFCKTLFKREKFCNEEEGTWG